jgi:GGDEF domain-containing protein
VKTLDPPSSDRDAGPYGVAVAIERATAAILAADPRMDPLFPVAMLRGNALVGRPIDPDEMIREWAALTPRSTGAVRYPWALNPKFAGPRPPWIGPEASWIPWRPREAEVASQPGMADRLVEWLLTPIIVSDSLDLLSSVADRDDGVGAMARAMLRNAMPKARRDAATWVQETHAWTDTWALRAIARRPRTMRLLHPFAIAIAEAYAESARESDGVVLGTRFPLHAQPLVSGSAHLAAGLTALGLHPKLGGRLIAWVGARRQVDGGFGDADGPSDPMTSLVAAQVLSTLDPDFDPLPTAEWLARVQRPDGWWCAYGPETSWLTVEVLEWLGRSARPFAERFEWPHVALTDRDRRTGLPFYGYYADLERLFAEVDGLSGAPVEVAFIDLAGFGTFNNAYGMEMGDRVLRSFAQAIAAIDGSIALRDGGDEFIVVGAPTGSGLADRLTAFRAAWPARLAAEFGETSPVAPRVLTTTTLGRRLVATRTALGIEIAHLKAAHPAVGATGIQVAMVPASG